MTDTNIWLVVKHDCTDCSVAVSEFSTEEAAIDHARNLLYDKGDRCSARRVTEGVRISEVSVERHSLGPE